MGCYGSCSYTSKFNWGNIFSTTICSRPSFAWTMSRLTLLQRKLPINKQCNWPSSSIALKTGQRRNATSSLAFSRTNFIRFIAKAADEPHIGYIAVPSGSQGKYHPFPPQEICLFFMASMQTGMDKKNLCMTIFGGHASQGLPGLNWMGIGSWRIMLMSFQGSSMPSPASCRKMHWNFSRQKFGQQGQPHLLSTSHFWFYQLLDW